MNDTSRFNAICNGWDDPGPTASADMVRKDLRLANVRYALEAGQITLGMAITFFLAEVIGDRVETTIRIQRSA